MKPLFRSISILMRGSGIRRSKASFALFALCVGLANAGAITFDFSGGSNSGGSYGNIRQYTVDGLSVNVSGWSLDDSGTWRPGQLKGNGGKLGVKNSRDDNTSKIDNSGWTDFVLFEFSDAITPFQMDLTNVGNRRAGGDSDLSIWLSFINPNPFENHIELDSFSYFPSLLGHSMTSETSSRSVSFNRGSVAGNALLISPYATHSDDSFKIDSLSVERSIQVPDTGTTLLMLILGIGITAGLYRLSRS